jgi:hypothetical protein
MPADAKTTFWGPIRITIATIGAVGSLVALIANADPAIEGAKRLWTRWTTEPAALDTTWQGEWTSREGFLFTFAMQIAVTPDDEADGSISWQLNRAPPGNPLAERVGSTAIEYVRGSFDRGKKLMQVTGYEVSDPTLIETDAYKLQIEPDDRSFVGMTKNHGEWTAQTTGKVIIAEEK